MKDNKKEQMTSDEIIRLLSKNNKDLIICRFDNEGFYENSFTGRIKEAFCFKTSYPKYEGKPLYVIYEEERELINWLASDMNTEYPKEKEHSKYIIEWEKKLFS